AFGPQGQQLLELLVQSIRESLAVAIDHVFLVGMIILLLALLLTFLIPEIPLQRRGGRPVTVGH
ncbi:MAG: MFS transporter, partial [Thermomicrobium sp.]